MWKRRSTCVICQSDENPATLRLGLCCINNTLRQKNIFCSRSLISRTYTLEKAKDLVDKNLKDLMTILEWNIEHNISHYRLSSDMFPRITDQTISLENRLKICDYKEVLYNIGEYAKKTNHRITMHPGQYNQVGAVEQKVLDRTIEDLSIHAEILDYMGMDENAILIVHGGGTYGNKENTTRRWIEQFDDLPSPVKKRLVIENCERQYNVEDVLYISEEAKIPVIFDAHHFNCYNQIYDTDLIAEEYIPFVLESWRLRRAVVHISEQKEDARIGAHSDFIEEIPDYFLTIPEKYGVGVDIEVEAKAKENAIFKLYKKYNMYN